MFDLCLPAIGRVVEQLSCCREQTKKPPKNSYLGAFLYLFISRCFFIVYMFIFFISRGFLYFYIFISWCFLYFIFLYLGVFYIFLCLGSFSPTTHQTVLSCKKLINNLCPSPWQCKFYKNSHSLWRWQNRGAIQVVESFAEFRFL